MYKILPWLYRYALDLLQQTRSNVHLWGQSSHGNILLDEVRCAGRVCAWLDHFDLFIRARCIM